MFNLIQALAFMIVKCMRNGDNKLNVIATVFTSILELINNSMKGNINHKTDENLCE